MEFDIRKNFNNNLFNEYDRAIFDLYLNSTNDEGKVLITSNIDFEFMQLEAIKKINIYDYLDCVSNEFRELDSFMTMRMNLLTKEGLTSIYIDDILKIKILKVCCIAYQMEEA